jgi:hypothetical protein
LVDGDQRYAPGTVLNLTVKKLRAHGRLAVGGEDSAAGVEESTHPGAVAIHRRLLDDG